MKMKFLLIVATAGQLLLGTARAENCEELFTKNDSSDLIKKSLILDCKLVLNNSAEWMKNTYNDNRLCVVESTSNKNDKMLTLTLVDSKSGKIVFARDVLATKMNTSQDVHSLLLKESTSTSGSPIPNYVRVFSYKASELSSTTSKVQVKEGSGSLFKIRYETNVSYNCQREL